jgi:Zn-dependent M28 family amino/carboxypeptidase
VRAAESPEIASAQKAVDTATAAERTERVNARSPALQMNQRAEASANVLATLKGTVNPELVYVVSSHYDSVAAGSGADDDSSGTLHDRCCTSGRAARNVKHLP